MATISAGQRCAYWRRLLGISRAELARRLGTSVPSVWRKEAGKQGIDAEEIPGIAKALGITTLQFYGEIETAEAVG